MNLSLKHKILNKILKNGVKTHSETNLKKGLKKIQKKFKKNSTVILKKSLINSSPIILLKQIKRKRKQIKEFPYILSKNLRLSYGLKFVLKTRKLQ